MQKEVEKPKRYSKRFVALFFCLVALFVSIRIVRAQTAEELKNKIDAHSQTIEQLQAEIDAYQKQLDSIRTEKQSLSNEVQDLDLTAKKFNSQISLTNKKIDSKNNDIKNLGTQISDKTSAITAARLGLADSIQFVNETDEVSLTEALLSADSLGGFWRSVDTAYAFQESVRDEVSTLNKARVGIEQSKSKAESAKQELIDLKAQLDDQKKIVDQSKTDKNKLLAITKNKESTYSAQLKQKIAEKDALEKEVRDYESQLKFILDPNKLPTAGSSPFSWPMDKIIITQLFGKTASSGRLYASGTHNGVDMGTSIGTPVKAMADGVVAGTGDTDVQCPGVSFGRFILIKYDNGLASTYGHLSLIKVSQGDRVTRGQVVGYSGNTGYSTGPHLHVSVYAKDSVNLMTLPSKSCHGKILTQPIAAINGYLDPMVYLPPR